MDLPSLNWPHRDREVKCMLCKGTGKELIKCVLCSGSGKYTMCCVIKLKCYSCKGEGSMASRDDCKQCGGRGTVKVC